MIWPHAMENAQPSLPSVFSAAAFALAFALPFRAFNPPSKALAAAWRGGMAKRKGKEDKGKETSEVHEPLGKTTWVGISDLLGP